MLPPLPRHSGWKSSSLISPSNISLPRKGRRVGLCIVLFEACSAFTHVAACTLALSPIRDTLIRGFSHFVTSMTAPIASGWSGCRVGLAPTGKRRLSTAHTHKRHAASPHSITSSTRARTAGVISRPRAVGRRPRSLNIRRHARAPGCLQGRVGTAGQATAFVFVHERRLGRAALTAARPPLPIIIS